MYVHCIVQFVKTYGNHYADTPRGIDGKAGCIEKNAVKTAAEGP